MNRLALSVVHLARLQSAASKRSPRRAVPTSEPPRDLAHPDLENPDELLRLLEQSHEEARIAKLESPKQ